jgi:hypothetical protein
VTAQTANRNTPYRGVTSITIGAKAAVHVYAGGFAFNDAGWGRGGVPTATTPVLGVVRNEVDNTSGANGALNVIADREGAYPFFNSASGDLLANTDIGNDVYAADDQTVAKTSNTNVRPIAGKLVAIDANGMCWVQIK